jgi:hypothetical protein
MGRFYPSCRAKYHHRITIFKFFGSAVFNGKTISKHEVHEGGEGKKTRRQAAFPPLCP